MHHTSLEGDERPAHSSDAGFTLIEMIVAMTIFIGVLAVASSVLANMLSSESTGRGADEALRQVNEAGQLLSNDLHAAMTPPRADFAAGQLRQVFQVAGPWPAGLTRPDFFDVIRATPTELWFRANVIPETNPGATPSTECVSWRAVSGGLERTVYSDWRGCSILLERRWVLRTVGPAPTNVFGYRMQGNVGSTPFSCPTVQLPAGVSLSGNDVRLARVATVLIDFSTLVEARGGKTGSMDTRSAAAIRTHISRDYRYALGCSR